MIAIVVASRDILAGNALNGAMPRAHFLARPRIRFMKIAGQQRPKDRVRAKVRRAKARIVRRNKKKDNVVGGKQTAVLKQAPCKRKRRSQVAFAPG